MKRLKKFVQIEDQNIYHCCVQKSGTVRKGLSGDWKNYFTVEHKEIFKKENGQLLIDLVYEKNKKNREKKI